MSFNPGKYSNQNHLGHAGKSPEKRLQIPLKKAIDKLNAITDKLDGNYESDTTDFALFLPRFWKKNSSVQLLKKEFSTRRDKKILFKGLHKLVGDKIILRDYAPIKNVLDLIEVNDRSLKTITNVYLNHLELIERTARTSKAFKDYFIKNLTPENFTSERVKLIYNSRDILTDYNGIKLFVETKLKDVTNIDSILRDCGFTTGNSDFKKLVTFQYLYSCYRKGQVQNFLKVYKEVLGYENMAKRVVPLLVLLAKESKQVELKKLAEEQASELIGSPLIKLSWLPPAEYKNEEVKRLEQARSILREWFLKTFVGVFFEQLAKDPRRKKYWLGKVALIDDIRVYGNNLELNGFIRKFKDEFGSKNSDVIKDRLYYYDNMDTQCGIVMNIGGYEIVEFTEKGAALYCYLESKKRIKSKIYNSRSLKITKMHMAINSDRRSFDEGRITHSGAWEERVNDWLKKYAI
jgi:hypothetical protein